MQDQGQTPQQQNPPMSVAPTQQYAVNYLGPNQNIPTTVPAGAVPMQMGQQASGPIMYTLVPMMPMQMPGMAPMAYPGLPPQQMQPVGFGGNFAPMPQMQAGTAFAQVPAMQQQFQPTTVVTSIPVSQTPQVNQLKKEAPMETESPVDACREEHLYEPTPKFVSEELGKFLGQGRFSATESMVMLLFVHQAFNTKDTYASCHKRMEGRRSRTSIRHRIIKVVKREVQGENSGIQDRRVADAILKQLNSLIEYVASRGNNGEKEFVQKFKDHYGRYLQLANADAETRKIDQS
mmetsp:Transcript_9601/g.10938  ORF Transcript_9601/g.10938 Transcript_9601/m.10938 type:complete len:291 (-) Transcript_9601:312-1184(-)|eukprot:CAMPEP_0184017670 /NCGR_PEP_ID=MMETSP0954-20121128/7678_1 /TAXON_ID=627963 /ORGANISM="Aplanochytrium sp, Strain PBS07" /LENGTH=290 /DNA_ID=CAMNT_0026298957 /DNA_START=378 /DNA_END=1250 /DNA_ORIENTATION=-